MKWTSTDISLSLPLFLCMIITATLLTNFLCDLKAVSNYWKYKVINTWVCSALSWPLQAGRMNLLSSFSILSPMYDSDLGNWCWSDLTGHLTMDILILILLHHSSLIKIFYQRQYINVWILLSGWLQLLYQEIRINVFQQFLNFKFRQGKSILIVLICPYFRLCHKEKINTNFIDSAIGFSLLIPS